MDKLGILSRDLELFERQLIQNDRNILWPNTPIGGTHQKIILRRTLSRDDTLWNPFCRSRKILKIIRATTNSDNFSILDIGCGDSIVLSTIKRAETNALAIGFDAHVREFSSYKTAIETGVILMAGYIQHAVTFNFQEKLDFALMLNSYRSWESAQLRDTDSNLQLELDTWISKNFRYAILTLSPQQICNFQNLNREITVFGRAENDAKFVLWKLSDSLLST